ncbi:phosphoglycolate phosphatase, bacterial [Campylobacterota bacterium]|nr:phosphoglycolate phosphatase, bacterial [Campylobacterota bacterium]
MKNTVIFDMDGTLLDSGANIVDSINYARVRKGLEPLAADDVIERVNTLTYASTRAFFGENSTDADHAAFEEYYNRSCLQNLRLYDGILPLLQALRDRGAKLAVATNATSVFAEKMLSFLGVRSFFGAILGADLVVHAKPDPDMLFAALELLGSKADDAVFVGDSGKDITAANSAGIMSVFVKWGYGVENRFATATIEHPDQLLGVI